MVAQQDGRRLDPVLLCDLDDRLSRHHRPASAAERAVRHDVNAVLLAEVDNLLLRQGRVVLNLVHRRLDSAVRQELLEITFAVLHSRSVLRFTIHRPVDWGRAPYVADADGLSLASCEELLHLLPGIDVVVVPENVARAIGQLGEAVIISWGLESTLF